MAATNKYVQCNSSLEDTVLKSKLIKQRKASKYAQCKPAVSNKSIFNNIQNVVNTNKRGHFENKIPSC